MLSSELADPFLMSTIGSDQLFKWMNLKFPQKFHLVIVLCGWIVESFTLLNDIYHCTSNLKQSSVVVVLVAITGLRLPSVAPRSC